MVCKKEPFLREDQVMGGTLLFFLQILKFPVRVPTLGTLLTQSLPIPAAQCLLRISQKGM